MLYELRFALRAIQCENDSGVFEKNGIYFNDRLVAKKFLYGFFYATGAWKDLWNQLKTLGIH